MSKELDTIVLTEDVPKHALKRGDIGTVVLLHGQAGYEVEFVTLDGETIAVVSLTSNQVRPIGRCEIAQARISRPPILPSDQVTSSLIDDLRDASHTYWTEYGYTKAFDFFVNDRSAAAMLAKLMQGKGNATESLQLMRGGFLGKWGSARTLTQANCPEISLALKRSASLLGKLAPNARIDRLTDAEMERVVEAFEGLENCRGIGATIASKILAALQPGAAVMWDMPIAAAYGFPNSGVGYRSFLQIIKEFAMRLRGFSKGKDLQAYLKPKGRDWKAPLAKVIDEWHWVRITQKHPYIPRGAVSD